MMTIERGAKYRFQGEANRDSGISLDSIGSAIALDGIVTSGKKRPLAAPCRLAKPLNLLNPSLNGEASSAK